MIKEKKLEEIGGAPVEDEFLKKTANLGDLVRKMQRPWYAREVNPDAKEAKQIESKYQGLSQYVVGQQIASFKTQQDDVCQVLSLDLP